MTLQSRLTAAFQAIGTELGSLKNRWGGDGAAVPNLNIDDITLPGSYFITSAVISGSPALSGITVSSGSNLLQFQYNSANAAQILVTHPGSETHIRIKDSGAWSSFQRLGVEAELLLRSELMPNGGGSNAGQLILGRLGTENAAGDTLGRLLFYNGDSSTGGSGRRIGGSVKLVAEDAYGDADLVFGVDTSDPITTFGQEENYDDNTIEVLRLIGNDRTARFKGHVELDRLDGDHGQDAMIRRRDGGSVNGWAGIGMRGTGTNGYLGRVALSVGRSDVFNAALTEMVVIDPDGTHFTFPIVGAANPDPGDTSGADRATLVLSGANGTSMGDGVLSSALAFTKAGSGRRRAMIAAYQDGADGDPHGLEFFTYNQTSTASDAVTSRGKIRASGALQWEHEISAPKMKADDFYQDRRTHADDVGTTQWYSIAKVADTGGQRAFAEFELTGHDSGNHFVVKFEAAHLYGRGDTINVSTAASYGANLPRLRILSNGTYDGAVLQAEINSAVGDLTCSIVRSAVNLTNGWLLTGFVAEGTDVGDVGDTGGQASLVEAVRLDLDVFGGDQKGHAAFSGDVYSRNEKLVTPSVLQKRYHMLSDYAPSSDAAECHDALQAFFTAGEGREMVIDKPTGSAAREYRMLDRADGTITLPLRGRIISEPGARLNWNDWSTGNTDSNVICLQRIGTWGAGDAISGAIPEGTAVLNVGSGNGSKYAPGQRCFLVSTEMFTLEEGSLGTKGEYLWVAKVDGDDVHFSSRTKYSYLSASTNTLYPDTGGLADLHFEGLQMIGPGAFDPDGSSVYDALGDRGLHVGNGNLTMRDGQVEGFDFINVFPVSVTGRMENVKTIQYSPDAAATLNSYGIAPANACDGFEIIDCETLGGKEGISPTATGSAFGIQGVTHNLVIRGGKSEDCRRSGVAFHDYHHEWKVENRLFLYCEQGLDVRTRNGHIVNNTFRHMGAFTGTLDCGVQFGSGSGNILLRNNTYEDVLRGHWMPDTIDHEETPGDFSFLGEVIRSTKQGYGTLMAFNGSARTPGTTELGTMVIENADYTIGDGGGSRAVEVHGRWKVSVQGVFRGGNGGQVVYLRAPDSDNSAGNGPINPSIEAKYVDTLADPLIQHHTGLISLKLEGIGHIAPGQSWQDNVYLNVPSLSPGQSTKLAATVTGVGLGDNVQITPAVADDYMTYYAHPTGDDAIEVTATNAGSSTQNPAGGQYYVTATKRKA